MLAGTTNRLTAAERAREPRSLGVVAWFDGHAAGSGLLRHQTFPRRLAPDEAREWRAGFAEGRRERVCHAWHGFTPCPGTHPVTMPESSSERGPLLANA